MLMGDRRKCDKGGRGSKKVKYCVTYFMNGRFPKVSVITCNTVSTEEATLHGGRVNSNFQLQANEINYNQYVYIDHTMNYEHSFVIKMYKSFYIFNNQCKRSVVSPRSYCFNFFLLRCFVYFLFWLKYGRRVELELRGFPPNTI